MNYLLLLLLSFHVTASPLAIYGEDNRIDPFTVRNSLQLKMADSTAAMIHKDHLTTNGPTTIISAKTLGDMYKLCPQERFRKQPVAASCSGTLIAPDLILTAAHCYEMIKQDCRDNFWVFDYRVSQDEQSSVTVPNYKIYKCTSVALKLLNRDKGLDHALIKLDRPVTDRPFAKIRTQETIKVQDELVLIGHPSGLPTKITAGGFILEIQPNFIKTNLDAFSMNSGSGVFNSRTGELEGHLVSGIADYNGKGNCSSPIYYQMAEGKEKVFKPTTVLEFLKTYKEF